MEQILAEMPYCWSLLPLSGGDIYQVRTPFLSQAERIASLVGERIAGDELDAITDHAWLVVMGQFAQALGLVKEVDSRESDVRPGDVILRAHM